MRLITWNINGVRTLPQYHPWNTLKTFDDILNHLEADIICFQEMKSGRKLLTKAVAVPPSYDAFFSFPVKKTGYSGVATYTRSSFAVPLKAEEGLTGIIQPKPPLTPTERVSDEGLYPVEDDVETPNFKMLDSEGRAVVVDLGLFVLINVYCPNDGTGTEERDQFKMAYHRLLEARVRGLIKEGREVIVIGDLNACAAVIDHCEGSLMVAKGQAKGLEGEEGFWGKDCRVWIRDWLKKEDGSGGYMVDVVRRFWPERKGMYTCWNTKISARESNYGTRIDFILTTPGLLPWIKVADTQPHVKGSDHCPVYVDFHDEITDGDKVVRLSDVLGMQATKDGQREPPRIAAKFWDEYSGKQTSLQQFFVGQTKNVGATLDLPSSTSLSIPSTPLETLESSQEDPSQASPSTSQFSVEASCSSSVPYSQPSTSQTLTSVSLPPTSTSSTSTKRKLIADYVSQSSKKLKKAKDKPTQASISSFFSKPPVAKGSTSTSNEGDKGKRKQTQNGRKEKEKEVAVVALSVEEVVEDCNGYEPDGCKEEIEDDDSEKTLQHSQEPSSPLPFPSSSSQNMSDTSTTPSSPTRNKNNDKTKSSQAWNTLLAPMQAPKCRVHGETAKEFTVNKPGPNKGKKFFICSRPVGPGYDKGRSERLREHVDPQYRCDYFKWSSDARKEMMKNGNGMGVS